MGSLFAGIGGFDLGFERAGFELAWHSEIEPHACAVLRRRWPDVPNLGDVTRIDGAAIEPVDVICGGFPCQDLSVAGKRRGFEGERSVLAFEFLRIVREMREATGGKSPAFIVLENVPGLFSCRRGRDFGALLDALAELGPLDVAWRVLDSRYFGVAQRRRRVFVVVDFGGERAEQVLALREGLRGDSTASRAARKDVAGTLGGGSSERGWSDDLDRCGAFVTGSVSSKWAKGTGGPAGDECYNPVAETVRSHPRPGSNTVGLIVAHTLRADGFDAGEDGPWRGVPLVADPISAHEQRTYTHEGSGNFRLRNVIALAFSENQRAEVTESVTAGALKVGGGKSGQGYPAVAYGIRNDAARTGEAKVDSPDATGRMRRRDAGFNVYREESPTLDATAPHAVAAVAHPPAVAFRSAQTGANGIGAAEEVAYTLDGASQGVASSGVRRLTPRECERLQGFPDDWTAFGLYGSPALELRQLADGPRYRCLGNAVTVNVAEWIARRMFAAAKGLDG